MSPWDLANGLFEFGGSLALWGNVRQILKDKMFRGVNFKSVLFFTSWGWFNMLYYPHLHQWLSFTGGLSITAANTVWIVLAWKYRKN